MIVEVLYAHTDGTTGVDRYSTPDVSTQLWDGGRALVRLLDSQGSRTGWAHYTTASRIRVGSAVPAGEQEMTTP